MTHKKYIIDTHARVRGGCWCLISAQRLCQRKKSSPACDGISFLLSLCNQTIIRNLHSISHKFPYRCFRSLATFLIDAAPRLFPTLFVFPLDDTYLEEILARKLLFISFHPTGYGCGQQTHTCHDPAMMKFSRALPKKRKKTKSLEIVVVAIRCECVYKNNAPSSHSSSLRFELSRKSSLL